MFRAPKVDFDPNAYETKQVFYTSKDGTRFPIFIAAKKGLTYRSYGEFAERVSDGSNILAQGRVTALVNHTCPKFLRGRDTEKLSAFLEEFDAFVALEDVAFRPQIAGGAEAAVL